MIVFSTIIILLTFLVYGLGVITGIILYISNNQPFSWKSRIENQHIFYIVLFPTDKSKEKLLKEFLAKLASSEIKDVEDIIDLEQTIENFVQSIEV